LFVDDLAGAYCKYALNNGVKSELVASTEGHVLIKFRGDGVGKLFQDEAGKHCIQRIPPTERNGRKQTSMISVAVLPIKDNPQCLSEKDLEITTQKGHGPGGQHQNKTESAVRVKHIPTGIMVFINGRDQHGNRREALKIITAKVNEYYQQKNDSAYNTERKAQLDGGGRSNKIRTYNYMESRAVDHRTGVKTGKVRDVIEKGRFDLLKKG